jgi:ribosomal protein L11 methyltransferase
MSRDEADEPMRAHEPVSEERFPFVLVDVLPENADVASYLLFELGAQGVEERDETTLTKNAAPGKVTLSASFLTHEDANAAVKELDPALNPRVEEIVGDAWRDAWKDHYKPFALCEGLVVRPPWEPYEPAIIAGLKEKVLELEPGRAFGTGLHETTSLVAETLSERRATLLAQDVLDVGCGSGILSLVALSFGARRAIAVDVDPEAVEVTRENAERNGMSGRVDPSTTDVAKIVGTFSVVVANIEAGVLVPMADALSERVSPSGMLVLSGILVPQTDTVIAAYPLFLIEEKRVKGEWTALVFKKRE